jgi:hypothetical protein
MNMIVAQAKSEFRPIGNVDVIHIGSYKPLVEGHVAIVEFEVA